MNLYDLHPDPENAPGYDKRYDTVPALVWEKYKNQPEELKKREKVLGREAKYAYKYAEEVLDGPFPAGEAAIAKHARLAYYYATEVLNRPFPAGEAAIAKETAYALMYARDALKLPEEEAKVWPKKLNEGLLAELIALL